jgi:predicted DNA-binding WGR domain protein
MTTNITIQEATYVDERSRNDKFFRTFAFDSSWVTQYGRNGTLGTFTKIVDAASPEAAQSAADAKFASKVKKGYNPKRAGVVASPFGIDITNVTALDDLVEALPEGTSTGIVTEPVAAKDLGDQRAADLTAVVRATLQSGRIATARLDSSRRDG